MGLDYYGLLELNRNATDEDIKKAYRKLALKFHPIRNDDPSLSDRFTAIAEAYDVLSTPQFKALFDQFGEEALKTGVPVPPDETQEEGPVIIYTFHGNPEKVYRDFFGVINPFADYYLPNLDPSYKFFEKVTPVPGPDQEHTCSLTLDEVYYGCTKTISIPLKVVDESGTRTIDKMESFTFKVPKGTKDGTTFKFRQSGTSGLNVTPGDVTFRVEIEQHQDFKLEGSDLVISRSLSLAEALTGCRVDVETFDGKTFHLPFSEVVKPGTRTVLKNEGMPVAGSSEKGDLIVEFNVIFPDRLSSKQKALIKQALLKQKK